jgi:GNAT superfamily N-acetyltransferase
VHGGLPGEHPDFEGIPSPEHPEIELDQIIAGRMMGPLLGCSGLALRADGTVAAAILVNDSGGELPAGGPWIAQFFRHPDRRPGLLGGELSIPAALGRPVAGEARGAGAPLLRRALALATLDGLPAIGLAVTDGNPAQRLYEAHGFAEVRNLLTVEL